MKQYLISWTIALCIMPAAIGAQTPNDAHTLLYKPIATTASSPAFPIDSALQKTVDRFETTYFDVAYNVGLFEVTLTRYHQNPNLNDYTYLKSKLRSLKEVLPEQEFLVLDSRFDALSDAERERKNSITRAEKAEMKGASKLEKTTVRNKKKLRKAVAEFYKRLGKYEATSTRGAERLAKALEKVTQHDPEYDTTALRAILDPIHKESEQYATYHRNIKEALSRTKDLRSEIEALCYIGGNQLDVGKRNGVIPTSYKLDIGGEYDKAETLTADIADMANKAKQLHALIDEWFAFDRAALAKIEYDALSDERKAMRDGHAASFGTPEGKWREYLQADGFSAYLDDFMASDYVGYKTWPGLTLQERCLEAHQAIYPEIKAFSAYQNAVLRIKKILGSEAELQANLKHKAAIQDIMRRLSAHEAQANDSGLTIEQAHKKLAFFYGLQQEWNLVPRTPLVTQYITKIVQLTNTQSGDIIRGSMNFDYFAKNIQSDGLRPASYDIVLYNLEMRKVLASVFETDALDAEIRVLEKAKKELKSTEHVAKIYKKRQSKLRAARRLPKSNFSDDLAEKDFTAAMQRDYPHIDVARVSLDDGDWFFNQNIKARRVFDDEVRVQDNSYRSRSAHMTVKRDNTCYLAYATLRQYPSGQGFGTSKVSYYREDEMLCKHR